MHGSSAMTAARVTSGGTTTSANSHGSSPASSQGKEMGFCDGSTRKGTSCRMMYREVSFCTREMPSLSRPSPGPTRPRYVTTSTAACADRYAAYTTMAGNSSAPATGKNPNARK